MKRIVNRLTLHKRMFILCMLKKQGLMHWLSNHDRDAEAALFMAAAVIAFCLFTKGAWTQEDTSFVWMEAAFLILAAPMTIAMSPKKIITTALFAIASALILFLTYSIPAWSPAVIALTILAGAIGMWKIRTMD